MPIKKKAMLTGSGIKIPKLIRSLFVTGIIFLLIMSLLRLALFLFFSNQGNSFGALLSSFALGLRYDLRSVSMLLLLLLLTGSFSALDPFRSTRGWKWALFLVGLAAFLLIFFYAVDFSYYSYLSQRLNASVLNYLADTSISAGVIWQTYPVLRIVILLVAGTWLIRWLVSMFYTRIRKTETPVIARKGRITWFIIALLILALGIFGKSPGQFPLRWSDAFALGSDYKANLSLNPFQSFFSSLKFRHSVYNVTEVRKAIPTLAPYFGFTPVDSLPLAFSRQLEPRQGALTTRPNVVVVICESFSGYKSSMWGNPLNTTPFFNGMCQQGVFFDHCFTPSYGTARGVWAVITGIPDVESSATTSSRNPAAVDQHTIINDFEGYDKFYFLGGSTSWANIRGLLTNNIKGLQLHEQQDYSAPKIDVWGISDKNLFLEANKTLRQQTQPFFAIIQTADNHRPYTIPEEDRHQFHALSMPKDSLHKYGFESDEEMNAFRYTDFGYRTFIETASKEPYFNNTVFLFVGDHGIPGDAGAMFPRAWTDQRLSAEHVPLLMYSPKLLAPLRDSGVCSQVDVLPTLAGLCHIPYRNSTLGRDLLDTAVHKGKELAFIYDFEQGYIGVIRDGYYYRRQPETGKQEMVSIRNNDPVSPAEVAEKQDGMRALTNGIHETAKYMLLQNKKRSGK
jgi:phosphoglycerol transferase MdoB-like AlkP superfamily enzyme